VQTGSAVNASTSVFALSIRVPIFDDLREPAGELATDSSQRAATVAGSG
jgi:hypothetical protein